MTRDRGITRGHNLSILNNISPSTLSLAWRTMISLYEAKTVSGLVETIFNECQSLIPHDTLAYVELKRLGGTLPRKMRHYKWDNADTVWEDYLANYHALDPVKPVFNADIINAPIRSSAAPGYYQSEFFLDFFKRTGVRTHMATQLRVGRKTRPFAFVRMLGSKDFSEKDEALLALLSPHLAHCFELCEFRERNDDVSGLLEQGHLAAWNLSTDFAVLGLNEAANSLMTRWSLDKRRSVGSNPVEAFPSPVQGLLWSARNIWTALARGKMVERPSRRILVNLNGVAMTFSAVVTPSIKGGQTTISLLAERIHDVEDESGGKDYGLTKKEKEIAALIAEGHTNAEIAESLSVVTQTVKQHVSAILRKTGCNNRTQLARRIYLDNRRSYPNGP